jgi:hypothetical protein
MTMTEPQMKPSSPATSAAAAKRPTRVPMSTARQRLQVQAIPGYKLYWFKEENVPAALDAYYEFVRPEEVHLNQLVVANAATQSGGTDLGTRISMVADKTELGGPVRAYLMKIKLEWWTEDRAELAKRNMAVMEAIFGEEALTVGEGGAIKETDPSTYIDRQRTSLALFGKPVRKARNIGKGRLT